MRPFLPSRKARIGNQTGHRLVELDNLSSETLIVKFRLCLATRAGARLGRIVGLEGVGSRMISGSEGMVFQDLPSADELHRHVISRGGSTCGFMFRGAERVPVVQPRGISV